MQVNQIYFHMNDLHIAYKQGTCIVYPFAVYEIYGVGVA